MVNYNRCNGCKHFYIGVSWLRVCVVYVVCVWGHYETGCSDSDCVGLFDFVMAHYADDIALMRLNLWNDTGV